MSALYNSNYDFAKGSGNPNAKPVQERAPQPSVSPSAEAIESGLFGNGQPAHQAPPVFEQQAASPMQVAQNIPGQPIAPPQVAQVNFDMSDLVEQPDNGLAELKSVIERYTGPQPPQPPQYAPPSNISPGVQAPGAPYGTQPMSAGAPPATGVAPLILGNPFAPAPTQQAPGPHPDIAALANSVQSLAQQRAPQQAPAGPPPMEEFGLNPADTGHQYIYDLGYRAEQQLSQAAQETQALRTQLQQMQHQQHVSSAQSQFTPRVAEALRPYGQVPAETIHSIASTAANMTTMGYGAQQALAVAVEPHLPMLRQMAQAAAAAPPPQSMHALPYQTQPTAAVGLRQALADPNLMAAQSAVSLQGGAGHQPSNVFPNTATNIPIEAWESALFGNN